MAVSATATSRLDWLLPGPTGPGDLAFQKRLQDSQCWPIDRLRDHQIQRLRHLVAHAQGTVRFHRDRFAAAGIDATRSFDWTDFRRLPCMTRADVQRADAELVSTAIPVEHGGILVNRSSGSTGTPVTVRGTVYDAAVAKAMTLRQFLWHPHDFTGRYASIRRLGADQAKYPTGATAPRWGDSATFPFATGPAALLNIGASIAQQAEWLARQDPDYLLSYPSNLLFLAEHCREHGIALPHLEHVTTMGEVVNAEARAACREAFDAPLIDTYTAEEVGAIAFQCPEHAQHLHVQAETIVVEVIDEAGEPCAPGQVGKIVVTPLFNYATPLIRYELGDYAEPGEPCACGRELPVLRRVLGRERNALLVTPTGERFWPAFGSRGLARIAPVLQHQFVQTDLDRIEAHLVVRRPLTTDEETQLCAHVRAQLPWPFEVSMRYESDIPRNAGGKFENFVSQLAA